MKRKEICKICSINFEVYNSRPKVTYCSIICKRLDYKSWHAISNGKYIFTKKVKLKKIRFKWFGATETEKVDRLAKIFNKHVIRQEGCWDWNGGLSRGYACMVFGEQYKFTGAHRISWRIHYGEIPEKLLVLHKCDNKCCTNPEHLFLGTHKDNVQDMISKGRNKVPFGSDHANSKLTVEKVLEIKKLLKIGVTMKRISKDYNISNGAICAIKMNKTWKHVII